MRPSLLSLALALALPAAAAHPPAAHGTGGAVACDEATAAAAGVAILARGGNAVDAAVATALVLAVVHPEAGNLGGGGFALARVAGEAAVLDFRETAPAAARGDMFLGPDGRPDPARSLVGPLAAGVPGSPAGLFELHRRFGRLPWRQVVRPAAVLARDGFVVSARTARSLADDRTLLARFPETAAVWLPGGAPPAAGVRLRLPALARTLEAYGRRGPDALVRGPLAAAVAAAARRHGGVLTAADLADYRPVWRDPLRFDLAGWNVASMPLPSSGGAILAATAAMLEHLRWRELPRFGADRAHLLAEVWRLAFADRFLLGDPAGSLVTLDRLLDPRRLTSRAAGVDRARATPSGAITPGMAEVADTTHISVVDAAGAAVALTTTLNGSFGCGLLVPEAGFLLNNEMDDFTAAPGLPNLYGLIQGDGNRVAPGRRPLSSMAPTVAARGEEVLVLGGRGGSKIPTAVAQVLLAVVVDGDPLQAAVDLPRVHHQWLPDELAAEADALAPETATELARRGHRLTPLTGSAKVNAARRLPGGAVEAAGDPRGPGSAAVVRPAA